MKDNCPKITKHLFFFSKDEKKNIYIFSSLVDTRRSSPPLTAKEPYKKDDILQKRPIILRSLLIVTTP